MTPAGIATLGVLCIVAGIYAVSYALLLDGARRERAATAALPPLRQVYPCDRCGIDVPFICTDPELVAGAWADGAATFVCARCAPVAPDAVTGGES